MRKNIFCLQDRVYVITGASGLLGKMHADAIAAFGGIPILLDLNESALKAQAEELMKNYSVPVSWYVLDITDESEISLSCGSILSKYGKLDGLINNAANNPKVGDNSERNFSRLEAFSMEDWCADISVGLTGAFLCCKHYGAAIASNPNGGAILNIASDLALIAPDQRLYRQPHLEEHLQPVKPVTYSVVKSGLIGLTRYMATYWPQQVRCNALCPGGVRGQQSDEFIKAVNNRIPLGRLAEPEEYQAAIIFLLSDASIYANGTILTIDGGRTVW